MKKIISLFVILRYDRRNFLFGLDTTNSGADN